MVTLVKTFLVQQREDCDVTLLATQLDDQADKWLRERRELAEFKIVAVNTTLANIGKHTIMTMTIIYKFYS